MSDGLPDLPDFDGGTPIDLGPWLDDTGFDEPPDDDDDERSPRRPRRRPADPDPEVGTGFTVLLLVMPVLFFAFYMLAATAPATWGPFGAFALAGAFGLLYLGMCWVGAKWIEGYRRI